MKYIPYIVKQVSKKTMSRCCCLQVFLLSMQDVLIEAVASLRTIDLPLGSVPPEQEAHLFCHQNFHFSHTTGIIDVSIFEY